MTNFERERLENVRRAIVAFKLGTISEHQLDLAILGELRDTRTATLTEVIGVLPEEATSEAYTADSGWNSCRAETLQRIEALKGEKTN